MIGWIKNTISNLYYTVTTPVAATCDALIQKMHIKMPRRVHKRD